MPFEVLLVFSGACVLLALTPGSMMSLILAGIAALATANIFKGTSGSHPWGYNTATSS